MPAPRAPLPWLRLAAAACLAALAACSDAGAPARAGDAEARDGGAARPAAEAASPAPAVAATAPAPGAAAAPRREPPLPAFEGWTLEGERLSLSSLLGRRLLLFLFNPEVAAARPAAAALAALAGERAAHNFEIVGVAQGSDRERAGAFLSEVGLDAKALDDPAGAFGARVGLRAPVGLLLVDAEGYVVQAMGAMEDAEDPAVTTQAVLREWLRLPQPAAAAPLLGERPPAPAFRAEPLDGGAPFELASLRGRPAVLIFFLHTCPHCHHALRALREVLDALPEARRPRLVGISVVNRTHSVRTALQEQGLDFFPVLLDPDGSIRRSYGAVAGVPVVFLLDAEGRIVSRSEGWREDRDPPLLRMRLARLAGEPVPLLLHKTGFSGSEFCGVCHEAQHETWELTTHAGAFDTLVRHGADRRADCVGCHVVGYEAEGGFKLAKPVPALEGVGCESCHGRGGPHLSPEHARRADYGPVCSACHTPEHSLGFELASFLPRVSHAANVELAALPMAEKRRLLAERRKPRGDLLPTNADYVGSAACRSCHEAEYATWAAQPHARAVASLEAKGRAGGADCLRCHVTGFGLPGGFPKDGTASDHPDLAAVGCESCHGPGAEHVKEGARRIGTIVSLGDKCDSCVILQLCGGCHDEANDPGFEFAVEEKIERQRHGTIEAGTGKPLGREARLPASAVVAALERALASGAPAAGGARASRWTAR